MRIWILLAALVLSAGCKKSGTPATATRGDASAPTRDDQPVTLKVKWPVGNRYTQRMEVVGDSETRMPQMPKPMAQKVNLNQEYNITVVGQQPKSGPELELEFESTEMDVNVNGKPMVNLDTKAEAGAAETDPTLAGFRQVVGAKIKFFLNESNMVEKVEGVKEFLAKATGASNPQGRATMQAMFNEEYFKQMVDFQRGLPAKPVRAGDSWPVKLDLSAPVLGKMNIDMNYTFKGWQQRNQHKCAAIDFAGSISSDGNASPGAGAMGMNMKVASGKLSGTTWFDPELGHPVETAMDQDMVIHMTMPAGPGGKAPNSTGMTQTITNNTKQKIVIKLVDLVSAGK